MKQTPASTGTLVTIQHIIHKVVCFKFYHLLKEMADIHFLYDKYYLQFCPEPLLTVPGDGVYRGV